MRWNRLPSRPRLPLRRIVQVWLAFHAAVLCGCAGTEGPGRRAGASASDAGAPPGTAAAPRAPADGVPGAAAATTFSVQREGEAYWLSGPSQKRFFSLGACVIDQGIPRQAYQPAKPAYAAWRYYPSAAAWAGSTLDRLRSWGFTTIGGWSDAAALQPGSGAGLPLTPVLGAGMEAGAPWFDLWDAGVLARIEELARARIRAAAGQPQLLGYYTDNEMGWWNGALFKLTLEHPPASGQRKRLVELLREAYREDWAALSRDFDAEGAGDFAALSRGGKLFLRTGGDGIRIIRRFLEMVADRYYELLGLMVRRLDPRALNLGDRYQSFYYPEVARAAARHVDIVSTNLNAQWNDGTFARYFLDTLHALTGKPILVSEFYMASAENRTGNPNGSGLFPVAATQARRAEACRRTLSDLAALPYVVGADWFQYYDEPAAGRFDGENFNFGLVDVEDRPYEELTAAIRGLDLNALHGRTLGRRADATGGAPPAPADPAASFVANLALREWDRERGFVPAASEFPVADLYLAWSPEALFLGLLALDAAEPEYYRDGVVPEADRMLWTAEIGGQAAPIAIRIGAGRPPSEAPPGASAICISGKRLNVRVIALLRIDAGLLRREPFRAGDSIRLSSTLATHARAYRVEWKGEYRLAP